MPIDNESITLTPKTIQLGLQPVNPVQIVQFTYVSTWSARGPKIRHRLLLYSRVLP